MLGSKDASREVASRAAAQTGLSADVLKRMLPLAATLMMGAFSKQSGNASAKEHLGSAGSYMKIFELNKDQLTDPDKIKPGQVLHLP